MNIVRSLDCLVLWFQKSSNLAFPTFSPARYRSTQGRISHVHVFCLLIARKKTRIFGIWDKSTKRSLLLVKRQNASKSGVEWTAAGPVLRKSKVSSQHCYKRLQFTLRSIFNEHLHPESGTGLQQRNERQIGGNGSRGCHPLSPLCRGTSFRPLQCTPALHQVSHENCGASLFPLS